MALRFDTALFGRLVAAARESKQIAQERFAEMTGLSQSSLSRLESGTGGPNGTPGPPPRIDTIIAIEEALGRRPLSLAAAALGISAPGEPERRSLLEEIRFSEEITDERRVVLLEVAEVAIARSRTQQTQPPQGPRRGRPRRD